MENKGNNLNLVLSEILEDEESILLILKGERDLVLNNIQDKLGIKLSNVQRELVYRRFDEMVGLAK